MPDRSGTWETGFAELFAEHPEINPSIPKSHTADQPNRCEARNLSFLDLDPREIPRSPRRPRKDKNRRDRFRIFMRSSLRQSTTKLFAVGLGQLDEAPDAPAPLRGIERHLDGVSHLEALSAPATAHHDRRRAGLQEPMLHVSFVIFGVQ